jgi:hypothetical protein
VQYCTFRTQRGRPPAPLDVQTHKGGLKIRHPSDWFQIPWHRETPEFHSSLVSSTGARLERNEAERFEYLAHKVLFPARSILGERSKVTPSRHLVLEQQRRVARMSALSHFPKKVEIYSCYGWTWGQTSSLFVHNFSSRCDKQFYDESSPGVLKSMLLRGPNSFQSS